MQRPSSMRTRSSVPRPAQRRQRESSKKQEGTACAVAARVLETCLWFHLSRIIRRCCCCVMVHYKKARWRRICSTAFVYVILQLLQLSRTRSPLAVVCLSGFALLGSYLKSKLKACWFGMRRPDEPQLFGCLSVAPTTFVWRCGG